jgi:hypothetical protein
MSTARQQLRHMKPIPGGTLWLGSAGFYPEEPGAHLPRAAVFIQRLFTAYLPPAWGWVTLAWMRRREYV